MTPKTPGAMEFPFGLDRILPEAQRLARAIADGRVIIAKVTITQGFALDDFGLTTLTVVMSERLEKAEDQEPER